MAEWQFRQIVDTLQLLLVDLAQVPGAKRVDWDDWKAGGMGLSPEDPTLGKPQTPEARVERLAGGPKFARASEGFPLLATLARTIRATPYSIRAEQS